MIKKVLILGVSGMLGKSLFSQYAQRSDIEVYATLRATDFPSEVFDADVKNRFCLGVDAGNEGSIIRALATVKPDVVINGIAMVKASEILENPLSAITINAQFPHRLAFICQEAGARLIHLSSDAVFDGKKGMYSEKDHVSISDVYGMTKFLGEVRYPNCVTLRTSIIGHSNVDKTGLVEWFLAQQLNVRGFTQVIYSGFPTVELARIISNYILPNEELAGIYHVSSDPISKYDLLRMIADKYEKSILIEPCQQPVLNRSLDSSLFRSLTGYRPSSWYQMIDEMFAAHQKMAMKGH